MELKAYGYFYLEMLEGETQEQAEERLGKLLDKAGVVQGDCEFEVE